MKITPKVFASVVTLLAACALHAADSKPIARVIAIQDVETDDASGYATWLARINDLVKTKLGVDGYYHVYVSEFDGEKTGQVRTVAVAESVAALAKITAAIENDPVVIENRDHYRAIRKLEGRVLYQCVRFDGAVKSAHIYSTVAAVSDEPGYLKSLDGLRALFDKAGMADIKINVYRVIAGRTNYTHRISLSAPSAERLAALLDLTATDPQLGEWLASAAKYRTVVGNSTAHEITK